MNNAKKKAAGKHKNTKLCEKQPVCINIKAAFKEFDKCVREDIIQFDRPAFCYSYHHGQSIIVGKLI